MARAIRPETTTAQLEAPAAPPYYIATQSLYIGAARAHAIGDRVPPEHVERFGWAHKVRRPDEAEAAAPAPVPTVQPATDEGQAPTASTEKEG
ncbi:hypothetical protein [Nonomuraea sp. 10N515B]|uniref:hypothetical protein n=1 Tax=Nonomuraea sp. 10N515B TaxID=3457422 RepID=UPI003FCE21E5